MRSQTNILKKEKIIVSIYDPKKGRFFRIKKIEERLSYNKQGKINNWRLKWDWKNWKNRVWKRNSEQPFIPNIEAQTVPISTLAEHKA